MPQPPTSTTPATWAVTGQEEEPTIDENGQASTTHHVAFKTNTGHESTVSLPDSQFSAANVAEQINYKAGQITQVHTMTSANAPKPES